MDLSKRQELVERIWLLEQLRGEAKARAGRATTEAWRAREAAADAGRQAADLHERVADLDDELADLRSVTSPRQPRSARTRGPSSRRQRKSGVSVS